MKLSIRPARPSEYAAAQLIWRQCFPEDEESFVSFFFEECTGPEHILAAFHEQTMVGALHCFFGQLRFFNQRKPAVFLSGVGTIPAARKQGVAAALLKAAHQMAYEKGACAAVLQPFSFSFYRRFGYGVLSRHARRTALPGERMLLRQAKAQELFAWSEGYGYDGWFYRTPKECAQTLKDAAISRDLALCGKDGYALCERMEGKLKCYEAMGANVPGLCGAIAAQEGLPVEFGLPVDQVQTRPGERTEPFDMLRILDAQALFSGAPLNGPVRFCLEDVDCPWQQGGYRLENSAGGAQVNRCAGDAAWPHVLPETLAELAAGTSTERWFARTKPTFGMRRY